MKLLKQFFLIAITTFVLSACGGGGSSDDTGDSGSSNTQQQQPNDPVTEEPSAPETPAEPEPESPSVVSAKGMGVKGPLANAVVSVYKIDTSEAGFKGELIAEGITDENAALLLDVETQYLTEPLFIFEYTLGKELDDSAPVIPVLSTVVTSQQLLENTPVYATPLTTLIIELAILEAGQNSSIQSFNDALSATTEMVKATYGLGLLDSGIDPFTSAPVLTANTDQADSLAYRTVIEVFAAVMDEVKTQITNNGDNVAPMQLLIATAKDLSDGSLNGAVDGEVITEFASLSTAELQSILTSDPSSLNIPNSDTPITELNQIIADEISQLATDVTPQPLARPNPVQIAIVYDVDPQPAPAPTPDPEPTPSPDPEPVPAPAPDPDPAPAPDPEPDPQPEPVAPSVSLVSPGSNNSSITEGEILEVIVDAIDQDGDIESCSLSLNGQLVRAENSAPYTWGTANSADDQIKQGLPQGQHEISVTCLDNDGLSGTVQLNVAVNAPTPPPEPEPTTFSLTLNWNAPTQREDGSALAMTEIGGYEIYYFLQGTPQDQGTSIDVPAMDGNGQYTTSYNLELDQPGSYVFAISTYDVNGIYSQISDEVVVDIQ